MTFVDRLDKEGHAVDAAPNSVLPYVAVSWPGEAATDSAICRSPPLQRVSVSSHNCDAIPALSLDKLCPTANDGTLLR